MRCASLFAILVWVCAPAAAFAQSAAPAPSLKPAAPGPVLVDGKRTYSVSFGAATTQTATASQNHVPGGVYFIATPGILCDGTVTVTGSGSQALPGAPITSTGPFTFTRTGSPLGCAVTISSSAGGAAATIVFQ